jgi:hypothetical protein
LAAVGCGSVGIVVVVVAFVDDVDLEDVPGSVAPAAQAVNNTAHPSATAPPRASRVEIANLPNKCPGMG